MPPAPAGSSSAILRQRLARHRPRSPNATVYKNGKLVATGSGAAVLGDPRLALTWLANEVAEFASGLREESW